MFYDIILYVLIYETCESFVRMVRVKMSEAIDKIIYRGTKKLKKVTYERMKRKGGRVMRQLYLLLSNEKCDRYAPFDSKMRHKFIATRSRPNRFIITDAMNELANYGRDNCDETLFKHFKKKFDQFMDNFTSYQISG